MREARGAFITLEGVDGSGKSTQAAMLAERLREGGREVVSLREPGGTSISEKVRALLLDPANGEMADECELLLYEASRAQLVREVIEPALERGAVVVCDRFLDSPHAYPHGARGLSDELVSAANELGGADRLEAEGLAFQQRVRADYLAAAAAEPARVRVVDAAGEPARVARRIDEALAEAGALGDVSVRA